jgi:hypothetical protein
MTAGCATVLGCIAGDLSPHKESTMSNNTMNLWQVILALIGSAPLSKENIEKIFSVRLKETVHPSNDLYVFYEAKNLVLSDGLVFSNIHASKKKTEKNVDAVGLEVERGCITLAMVQSQYADLRITGTPRGSSLEEATIYSAKLSWGFISFGFREKNSNCLAHVAMRFI